MGQTIHGENEGERTLRGSTHMESVRTSCPFWRTAFSLIERSLFSLPTARICQAQRKGKEQKISLVFQQLLIIKRTLIQGYSQNLQRIAARHVYYSQTCLKKKNCTYNADKPRNAHFIKRVYICFLFKYRSWYNY